MRNCCQENQRRNMRSTTLASAERPKGEPRSGERLQPTAQAVGRHEDKGTKPQRGVRQSILSRNYQPAAVPTYHRIPLCPAALCVEDYWFCIQVSHHQQQLPRHLPRFHIAMRLRRFRQRIRLRNPQLEPAIGDHRKQRARARQQLLARRGEVRQASCAPCTANPSPTASPDPPEAPARSTSHKAPASRADASRSDFFRRSPCPRRHTPHLLLFRRSAA